MITNDYDVKINYDEVAAVFNSSNKNILVFVDDISKSLYEGADYFYKEIGSIEDLNDVASQDINPNLWNFVNTFFAQNNRPSKFVLALLNIGEHGANLTITPPSFDDLKTRQQKEDDSYNNMCFQINTEAEQIKFVIWGNLLEQMTSYNYLITYFNFCLNGHGVNLKSINESNLIFTRTDIGIDNTISYLEDFSDAEIQAMSSVLMTNWNSTSFASFKQLCGENHVKITFHIDDDDYALDIDLSGTNNWEEFWQSFQDGDHISAVYYDEDHNNVILFFEGNSVNFPTNTDGEDAPIDFVNVLNLIAEKGAIKADKPVDVTIFQSKAVLNGTAETGAVLTPYRNNIWGSSQVMGDLKNTLNYSPASIVLSRNLTVSNNVIDQDATKNYMNGFLTNFQSSNGQPPTCILSLASDVYQVDNKNPYSDFTALDGSRCLVMNYTSIDKYLDGAIGAYIASVNHEGENTVRNTKGLSFNSITPDSAITNVIADIIKENRMNCYSLMENNLPFYREGITMSTGDVGYIDIAISLNAIIRDIRDAFIRLLKGGKLKLNPASSSLVYSTIANVCSKYVTNGFLSNSVKSVATEMGTTEVAIPPYRIVVARSFTEEQLMNRTFPDVKVYLASSMFANEITITLSSAYLI